MDAADLPLFRIIEAPRYWWPVDFRTPSADRPGEFDAQRIEVEYRYLDDDEQKTLMEEVGTTKMIDPEFARRVVTDFRHVADSHGNQLLFSPDAFAHLLRVPTLATAIARTYFDSRAKAAEKN